MSTPSAVRVSYIIITKNRAEHLDRALANVREFIAPCDELIIIDGASTDNTREVANRHRDIITSFVSEPDCGEGHAFNKGLWRARGRYIKGMGDDDYFYPDAMLRLVAEMEAHPEIEAIQCGGEIWEARDGRPTFVAHRFLPESVPATTLSIFECSHNGLGIIIRRTAFEKTGGVSNNYKSVDGDLICRLVECNCELRYLDVNLYRWYFHPHSGFNDKARMAEDERWFLLRTGRYDQLVFPPPQLVTLHANHVSARRAHAFFRWLWIAGLAWRSPLWPISLLLYRPLEIIVFCVRRIKGLPPGKWRPSHNPDPTQQLAGHEWSGELR